MPPFPPVGPFGRFPTFFGTSRALRRPGPFPPRFVAFAWQYHSAFAGGDPRDSQVPGWTPVRTCPALGPRRDLGGQAFTAPEVQPSAPRTASAPSTRALSGLDHTACSLAVYASRPGLSPDPCKTRFRLVANRYRVGFDLPGPQLKVSETLTSSLPPSPGLSWRERRAAPTDREAGIS